MRALFEVVTAITDDTKRRLTTAANVRAMIGSASSDDAVLETLISRASAAFATYCKLAKDAKGTPPSFGEESLRATYAAVRHRDDRATDLVLPWRPAITAITSVVENGVSLVAGTDYQLKSGGILERLYSDRETRWRPEKIVVEYTAGWELPGNVPADIEAAAIDQVKYMWSARERDPSIRSENVPDVYQVSFNYPGGSSIGDSGLLISVEAALVAYRDWSV
ncbi:hypothetical protein [Nitrobacter sp.]|uniref:hypothetical protein n=1 Tax=Nitrobacter sp. TaxID=29420 RepID=UPI0029CABED6|nr:hypothetical protein [Nitrobacter sp.]